MGVVFVRWTPEPTAAPTCAVESEGGIEQCRRGTAAQSLPRMFRSRRVQGGSFRHASTRKRDKERLPRGRTCEFTRTGRNTMWGARMTSLSHPQTPQQTPQASRYRFRRACTQRSDETTRLKQHTKQDSKRPTSAQGGRVCVCPRACGTLGDAEPCLAHGHGMRAVAVGSWPSDRPSDRPLTCTRQLYG